MNTESGTALLFSALLMFGCKEEMTDQNTKPNVILIMADDLGYGDLGCYGNKIAITPNLDAMAKSGIKLNRFYSAAPVSSPTRASCLTGRHPSRVNIPWAGDGFMPSGEITIAEALAANGYTTGHFGKWHVGELSKTINQSYFEGDVNPDHYSPPWENGFDVSFSTESMMPTYNPYYMVGVGYDGYQFVQNVPVAYNQQDSGFVWRDRYWSGEGEIVDEWLGGDDSKIIMDRAIDFMDKNKNSPFLSLVWFHTPHTPVVASNEDRALYPDLSIQEQHWFGSITALDREVGRLKKWLEDNGLAENTIIWFCSDNGPSYRHSFNSAGELRGKKSTLYEGGIRVPAIIEWPAKLSKYAPSDAVGFTSDIYPSILWATGTKIPENQPLLDGENMLVNLIDKKEGKRRILFRSPLPNILNKSKTVNQFQEAVIENRYKLISTDNGATYQLYDLENDIKEEYDIASKHQDLVQDMRNELAEWVVSCNNSSKGNDYIN